MAEPTVTLNVTRYQPEHDREPRMQSYTIPYREDWVVLDALNHIKDQIDGTLSYRWSCRMGVCGSCGMMVNGEPKLSCETFLRDLHHEYVTASSAARASDCRRTVLRARGRLEALLRRPALSPEKRAEKEEILSWVRVWLETPDLFPAWLDLRKRSLH